MPLRQQVKVTFRVKYKAPQGFKACVVGSCVELGIWNPRLAKVMKQDPNDTDCWSIELRIRRQESLKYRFFICMPVWKLQRADPWDLTRVPGLSILCWESAPVPRILDFKHVLCDAIDLPMTELSSVEYHRSMAKSSGWLLGCTQIRLTLCGDKALEFTDDDQWGAEGFAVDIRCRPIDYMRLGKGTAVWDRVISGQMKGGLDVGNKGPSRQGSDTSMLSTESTKSKMSRQASPNPSRQASPQQSYPSSPKPMTPMSGAGRTTTSSDTGKQSKKGGPRIGAQFDNSVDEQEKLLKATKHLEVQKAKLSIGSNQSGRSMVSNKSVKSMASNLSDKSTGTSKKLSSASKRTSNSSRKKPDDDDDHKTTLSFSKASQNSQFQSMSKDLMSRLVRTSAIPMSSFGSPAMSSLDQAKPIEVPPFATRVTAWKLEPNHKAKRHCGEMGLTYGAGDNVNFCCDTVCPEALGFRFDLSVNISGFGSFMKIPLGFCHIPPLYIFGEFTSVPIFDNILKHIGNVNVRYMSIQPVPKMSLTMETSFQNHLDLTPLAQQTMVESGLVGVDNRNRKIVSIRENTLATIKAAANQGARWVELNIQLTTDKVPVLYHKPALTVYRKSRCPLARSMVFEIPVSEFTFTQMQNLTLPQLSQRTRQSLSGDIEEDDRTPFPSLAMCLDALDTSIGVFLVIKCPNTDIFNMREQVDSVLSCLFERFTNRRVVLSSFDPDICIMMHKKQNLFPVVLGCTGIPEQSPKDTRHVHLKTALCTAQAEKMLGVCVPLALLLVAPSVTSVAKRMGLSVFVWSEEDVEPLVSNWLLHKQNVDVTVTDHMRFNNSVLPDREVFELPHLSESSVNLTRAIAQPHLRIGMQPIPPRYGTIC